ncbi:hypothetical protein EB001_21115, partial [bacterium]|nr:hypothetical protein [bacterium]
ALASLSIDLNGGSLYLNGGDISVVASSIDSTAGLDLANTSAYGSLNLISVVAGDDSAYAYASIDIATGSSIVIGSSSANDHIFVSALYNSSFASLDINGTIELKDNLDDDLNKNFFVGAVAQGQNSSSTLNIETLKLQDQYYSDDPSSDRYTNLNIEVSATNDNAVANLDINSLYLVTTGGDGSSDDNYLRINEINVKALGTGAEAYGYIGGAFSIDDLTTISLDVSNYVDASASLGLEGISIVNDIGVDFNNTVSADQAFKALEINSLNFSYDGSFNLVASGEDSQASLYLGQDRANGFSFDANITNIDVIASGINSSVSLGLDGSLDFINSNITVSANLDAGATLDISGIVDESDINSIVVETDGNNASALAYLSSGSNDLSIDGDISVLASGSAALASLSIDLNGGSLYLNGGDISVVASSVDSTAGLDLRNTNAYGSLNLISVVADDDSAYAYASLDIASGASITIGTSNVNDSIMVLASHTASFASLDINGTIELKDNVNDNQDKNFFVGAVAAGQNSSARLNIDTLKLYDQYYSDDPSTDRYTHLNFEVSATNEDAVASLNVNSLELVTSPGGSSDDNYLNVNQINVKALEIGAEAYAYIGGNFSIDSLVDISLDISNYQNASVSLGLENLSIINQDAYQFDTNVSADNAYKALNIEHVDFNYSGVFDIRATGENAIASLHLGQDRTNDLSFDATVTEISVEASGYNSSAYLDISGSLDFVNSNISVFASQDASAYVNIQGIIDESDINNIRVSTDGNYGSAEAYLSSDGGDLSINGDISVLASGSAALASLSIDLAGGSLYLNGEDFSVVASSVDSSAFANLHGADAYG